MINVTVLGISQLLDPAPQRPLNSLQFSDIIQVIFQQGSVSEYRNDSCKFFFGLLLRFGEPFVVRDGGAGAATRLTRGL